MKTMTKKTALRALVNYKCLGKFGKCLRGFSAKERAQVLDIWEGEGWITPGTLKITGAGDMVIIQNLSLCE